MSQLNYNEIKQGVIIIYNGEPHEVLESHVARTQQRKPQNQTKLKSLKTGKNVNATFHTSDSAQEADIEKKDVKFLYANKGEYWFCDIDNPKNRFTLPEELINSPKFLKENEPVTALMWDNDGEDEIIGITLPIKVTFLVKEAPPAVKGNTQSGGNKQITLENGAIINAPLFIETGTKVIVNTQTGEYVERAS